MSTLKGLGLRPLQGLPALASAVPSSGSILASIITAGQSNAWLVYDQARTDFDAVLAQYWTKHSGRLAQGATSGSAAMMASVADPEVDQWWYDDIGDTWGPSYDTWLASAQAELAAGRRVSAILWDQGESDFGVLASQGQAYQDRYKATLLSIFNEMRSVVGSVPVVIAPIGRRGTAVAVGNVGYQLIRDIQKVLDTENSFIHLGPEKYDLPDDTGPHLAYPGTSYPTLARREARKVLSVLGYTVPGGVQGPVVASAVRDGLTITVNLTHDASGTDFTPSSAIEGFYFTNDGTQIAISAAVRTDADTITLTLASLPTGVELLYYLYNHGQYITDYTKIVKDNQAEPLALRSDKREPARVAIDSILSGAYFNRRAREMNTTTQLLPSAVLTPAEGYNKSAFRGKNGAATSVAADDLTFVPAAGGVPAFLQTDGGDVLYGEANPAPARLKQLSLTGAHSYFILVKVPADWTGSTPIFYQHGGNNATTAGFGVRWLASTNMVRITTSDGAASANLDIACPVLPTSGYLLFVFTYDAPTKAYKFYRNSLTPTAQGTHTAAKQAAATVEVNTYFSLFPATSGLIEDGMVDHVMTDAEVTALRDYLEAEYAIDIF